MKGFSIGLAGILVIVGGLAWAFSVSGGGVEITKASSSEGSAGEASEPELGDSRLESEVESLVVDIDTSTTGLRAARPWSDFSEMHDFWVDRFVKSDGFGLSRILRWEDIQAGQPFLVDGIT